MPAQGRMGPQRPSAGFPHSALATTQVSSGPRAWLPRGAMVGTKRVARGGPATRPLQGPECGAGRAPSGPAEGRAPHWALGPVSGPVPCGRTPVRPVRNALEGAPSVRGLARILQARPPAALPPVPPIRSRVLRKVLTRGDSHDSYTDNGLLLNVRLIVRQTRWTTCRGEANPHCEMWPPALGCRPRPSRRRSSLTRNRHR